MKSKKYFSSDQTHFPEFLLSLRLCYKPRIPLMKYIFLFFLLPFLSGSSVLFAQKDNPNYDSVLAQKYGADERGMKMYIFCILKTGPVKDTLKAVKDSLFAGHMKNIGRLAEEGKLVMAGPFGKNERSYRGLYVFNVSTVKEAEELLVTDPAVQAGLLVGELTPLYCSAALMGLNETHWKLTKKR